MPLVEVGALRVLEVMVIAVVLVFEGGRAATLTGWGLVVMALLVSCEVWKWCRHSVPLGYRLLHDLPNKPLSDFEFCKILKTKTDDLQDHESA